MTEERPDEILWQIQTRGVRAYGMLLTGKGLLGIHVLVPNVPKIRLYLRKPIPHETLILLPGGIVVLHISMNFEATLRRRKKTDHRFLEILQEDRSGQVGLSRTISQEQGEFSDQYFITEATGAVFSDTNHAYIVLNVLKREAPQDYSF